MVNKIDVLLQELCPEGIVFKPISEAILSKANIKWKDVDTQSFKYIDLGSVDRSTNVISGTLAISKSTAPSRAQQIVKTGDILFGTTRPTLKRLAVIGDEYNGQICSTGFCVLRPDPEIIVTNFLYYLLGSEHFMSFVERTQKGASYPSISDSEVKSYKIPLPPLKIQKEIVDILDKFTETSSRLSSMLSAEIEARQKQYTNYRKNLLTFNEDIHEVRLDELSEFINAKPHEKHVVPDGDIALMTSKFVSTQGKSSRKIRSENVLTPAYSDDIALVMSDLPNGRALARAFFVESNNKYAANQRVCLLRVFDKNRIDPKFLYYSVDRNKQLLKFDSGFDQTHLKRDWIVNIKIHVPPIEEQKKIVRIIDELGTSITEIVDTLVKEQESRGQQYEFYRTKLLSFQELVI